MCVLVCGTPVRQSPGVRVALEAGGLSDLLTEDHGSSFGGLGKASMYFSPPSSDRRVHPDGGGGSCLGRSMLPLKGRDGQVQCSAS